MAKAKVKKKKIATINLVKPSKVPTMDSAARNMLGSAIKSGAIPLKGSVNSAASPMNLSANSVAEKLAMDELIADTQKVGDASLGPTDVMLEDGTPVRITDESMKRKASIKRKK